MHLNGSVVVITGAAGGLGTALTSAFKKAGAVVIPTSRTNENGCRILDVTKEADVLAFADAIVQEHGRIDVWVNNAGIWHVHAPVEEQNWDKVHQMMEVNVFGTMYGSKAALLHMKKQGGGAIVNIISTSALEGRYHSSGYCATKFAAAGFTKSLRVEAQDFGITVIGAYPDRMQTHLFDEGKPHDYANFLDPNIVATKIVTNLTLDTPDLEPIYRRV